MLVLSGKINLHPSVTIIDNDGIGDLRLRAGYWIKRTGIGYHCFWLPLLDYYNLDLMKNPIKIDGHSVIIYDTKT